MTLEQKYVVTLDASPSAYREGPYAADVTTLSEGNKTHHSARWLTCDDYEHRENLPMFNEPAYVFVTMDNGRHYVREQDVDEIHEMQDVLMLNESEGTDKTVEVLLEEVTYLWKAQGPEGRRRGQKAEQELLWRFGLLPDQYWDWLGTERAQYHEKYIDTEVALMSIAVEAARRGYDVSHLLFDPDE